MCPLCRECCALCCPSTAVASITALDKALVRMWQMNSPQRDASILPTSPFGNGRSVRACAKTKAFKRRPQNLHETPLGGRGESAASRLVLNHPLVQIIIVLGTYKALFACRACSVRTSQVVFEVVRRMHLHLLADGGHGSLGVSPVSDVSHGGKTSGTGWRATGCCRPHGSWRYG